MKIEGRSHGGAHVESHEGTRDITLTVQGPAGNVATVQLDENWAGVLVLELQAKIAGVQARAVSR